jgi:hypothetical protein
MASSCFRDEVAEIDKDIIREGDALIRAYEKEIAGRK